MSSINGKLEFDAGVLNLPGWAFPSRAAGSLTLPVGSAFGLQADLSITASPGFSGQAAVHVFARDPASHLIGGALGIIRTPGALVVAGGPEAELYFDRWTVEAWAGFSYARPTSGPDRTRPMAMATLAVYPKDDLRLDLGLSLLDGYAALHAGAEYLLSETSIPLALTADARIGQDGAVLATLGLRGYFGVPSKTLIRRHREDDPADRSLMLQAAAGGETLKPKPGPAAPPDDAGGQPIGTQTPDENGDIDPADVPPPSGGDPADQEPDSDNGPVVDTGPSEAPGGAETGTDDTTGHDGETGPGAEEQDPGVGEAHTCPSPDQVWDVAQGMCVGFLY